MSLQDFPHFKRLMEAVHQKVFNAPLEKLTESTAKILSNTIFDHTGLPIGAKSLLLFSKAILENTPDKVNPSLATRDTLARFLMNVPPSDDVERKEHSDYIYWFKFCADTESPTASFSTKTTLGVTNTTQRKDSRLWSFFKKRPALTFRLSVYLCLLLFTLWYIRFDLRVFPWLFSPQPKHHWWVCEYKKEDGSITKVYYHPRSYRTLKEVTAYFTGADRRWLERKGDCDAFFFDEKGKKRHLCYGSTEMGDSYINMFGKIDTIYKEQAQISTMPDSLKIRLQ